ncbi:chemokine XC receptor 1 [Tenrec ecaudatus]|uniref:chemokine XC receptor 1 n=1 Tax=Tenrec ecaudatus TaxID=94439 RepID=UPI003F5AB191
MEATTFYEYESSTLLCESKAADFATLFTSILYSLVFLLSLMGNGLVLWVLVKFESLESLTNVFILNLCLSDLVFACLLPVWISAHHWDWLLGDLGCKLLSFIFSTSLYSSILILTIMTFHRYLYVVRPLSSLRSHTLRFRVLVTAMLWAVSILSSVSEAFFHKDLSNQCDYSATTWFVISVYQHNISFLLSLGIILFCYVKILRTLLHSRSQRRHRTVRLIFAIVLAYFLSWAPYNLTLFLQTLAKQRLIQVCKVHEQLEYAVQICRMLAFSHCCFNPVLYVFVGVKFHSHLKRLLGHFWLCRQQEPSHPTIPSGALNEGASFY